MKDYSKEGLVLYLFNNIPEYKEYWREEAKWRTTDRTYHTEIGCLLRFVNNEIEHDNIKHLPFIFNLIEELVECDDEDAENAAWTMFLEDIPPTPSDRFPKFSVEACHKYLGPKSLKALEIINAPLDPEIVLQREKEKQYKASILTFLLNFLYKNIKSYEEFREEDIKKWKEEGQDRVLPVEMSTLLEFVKDRLTKNDQETVKKVLNSVSAAAQYAKDAPDIQKLLEHWHNILNAQR